VSFPASVCCSLAETGLQVSTGPVVDFRVKDYLRKMPETGTVPLLYPAHFSGQKFQWPLPEGKKPNALLLCPETEKWLYPKGFYTVVRRFSSKEEKRRVVASVFNPELCPENELIGFENHLNVFHCNKKGLPAELAYGLAFFLNSTLVDQNFRLFSGHTQVNAADLKTMKYPSRQILMELGVWAMKQEEYD
jgi:hypothetical protein